MNLGVETHPAVPEPSANGDVSAFSDESWGGDPVWQGDVIWKDRCFSIL